MKIYYGYKSRYSGRLLQAELRGIPGDSINWGYQRGGVINRPRAIAQASNKRRALEIFREAGVPTPEWVTELPCVARPDRHFGGKGFYLCKTQEELDIALREGCTHLMEYIEGGREFRVHVAFGKSIKVAEKIGGNDTIRNFSHGSVFMYPKNFKHKKTLRAIAKAAVLSLGLDFGAIDVIYKNHKYYVLEVNSSPSLTSDSDILDRYVKAFTDNAGENTPE